MEITGVFKELIERNYVVVNQLVRIRWHFAAVEHFGRITVNGNIELLNQSYLQNEDESLGECVSQALVSFPDTSNLVPISVDFRGTYKAPSTATEHSYSELLNMQIVTPRNEEEKEKVTYEGILNPENVRHNGWRKIEFLYWSNQSPSIIFIPASKLRTERSRQDIRMELLRPFKFEHISDGMMPIDRSKYIENNLRSKQQPEIFQQTQNILRTHDVTSDSSNLQLLTSVIDKLAQALYYLRSIQEQNGEFMSHFSQRAELIENREDPMLLPPENISTEDILNDDFLTANLFDETPFLPFIEEQPAIDSGIANIVDVWTPIIEIYRQMNERFKELPTTKIDEEYYKEMSNYYYNSEMLKKLCDEAERCFGDRETFKMKFDEYYSATYNALAVQHGSSDPAEFLKEGDDPVKNASIQYFYILFDLKMFLDHAFTENTIDYTQFLTEKSVEVQTLSTETQDLEMVTVKESVTFRSLRLTGTRKKAPTKHCIVTKRLKRSV